LISFADVFSTCRPTADGFIILRANSIFKQNETNANGAKLAKLSNF
jgi:hypothetical protein